MSPLQRDPFDSENDDIESILQELEQMNPHEMTAFENCLEERMRQERLQRFGLDASDEEDEEEPLFTDLEIDYRRRPCGQRNGRENVESPIRSRSKRRKPHDISITAPALDHHEERMRAYDPESHDLLNRATRSLCSLYTVLDELDCLEDELLGSVSRQTGEADSLPDLQMEQQQREEEEEEEKENSGPPERRVGLQLDVDDRDETEVLDPRLRKVLAPAPGRTLYRHDPVTSHQMYMEEWKRRPTPEEQKRLSLRWKVRDYMMSRKFMPKKQPSGQPFQPPKDWSPRPYLD